MNEEECQQHFSRSAEEMQKGFEEARRALAAGPAATVAYMTGDSIEDIEDVMGPIDPDLFKVRRVEFEARAKRAASNGRMD